MWSMGTCHQAIITTRRPHQVAGSVAHGGSALVLTATKHTHQKQLLACRGFPLQCRFGCVVGKGAVTVGSALRKVDTPSVPADPSLQATPLLVSRWWRKRRGCSHIPVAGQCPRNLS